MPKSRYDSEWFESVLEAMAEMVLVKGNNSRLLWANRAFREYYRMSNEQLRDLIDSPASDPDNTLQYVKDDHHVFTTGETLDIPAEPVTDADGIVRYFHTIKSAIVTGSEVKRTVGTSRLVPDGDSLDYWKRLHASRKASVSELRALVANIPLAVCMLDAKQRQVAFSARWADTFDVQEPADRNDAPDIAGVVERYLPIASEVSTAIDGGSSQELHALTVQSKIGELIVDVMIQPWRLPDQSVGGAIIVIHDITEEQRNQEALNRVNDELSQFNYRISHDIVGPLHTLTGLIGICESQIADDSPEARELMRASLGRAADSTRKLTELVSSLLELARADASDNVSKCDLAELGQAVLGRHKNDFATNDIEVKHDFQPIEVLIQRVRVEQIVENLVSNAIKYVDNDEAQKRVAVSLGVESGQLVIRVEDNGAGVADVITDSLFEQFVRGSVEHPGSGLGLYIVKKHVSQLGGEVALVNARKNTVFVVKIPLSAL